MSSPALALSSRKTEANGRSMLATMAALMAEADDVESELSEATSHCSSKHSTQGRGYPLNVFAVTGNCDPAAYFEQRAIEAGDRRDDFATAILSFEPRDISDVYSILKIAYWRAHSFEGVKDDRDGRHVLRGLQAALAFLENAPDNRSPLKGRCDRAAYRKPWCETWHEALTLWRDMKAEASSND